MKKGLAIFCLLMVAAFCSLQPAAKPPAHSSSSTGVLKVRTPSHASTSMGASAEALRTLAIRRAIDCPDGYHDCNGCCVPYACLPSGQDRVE